MQNKPTFSQLLLRVLLALAGLAFQCWGLVAVGNLYGWTWAWIGLGVMFLNFLATFDDSSTEK